MNEMLHNAAKNKNDEFYTAMADIEEEMANHEFQGKSIHLNCDDYNHSHFWKYFHSNFDKLGLTKLTATGFSLDDECSPGVGITYDGENLNELDLWTGDFRYYENIGLSLKHDMIVGNPPFSLLNEWIIKMICLEKELIYIGNINCVGYTNIFQYFKNLQLFAGKRVNSFIDIDGTHMNVGGALWFTTKNPHREPLELTKDIQCK